MPPATRSRTRKTPGPLVGPFILSFRQPPPLDQEKADKVRVNPKLYKDESPNCVHRDLLFAALVNDPEDPAVVVDILRHTARVLILNLKVMIWVCTMCRKVLTIRIPGGEFPDQDLQRVQAKVQDIFQSSHLMTDLAAFQKLVNDLQRDVCTLDELQPVLEWS